MKHEWKGKQLGGNPAEESSYEWVCYCDLCGIERNDDNADQDCVPLCEGCGGELKPTAQMLDREPLLACPKCEAS